MYEIAPPINFLVHLWLCGQFFKRIHKYEFVIYLFNTSWNVYWCLYTADNYRDTSQGQGTTDCLKNHARVDRTVHRSLKRMSLFGWTGWFSFVHGVLYFLNFSSGDRFDYFGCCWTDTKIFAGYSLWDHDQAKTVMHGFGLGKHRKRVSMQLW